MKDAPEIVIPEEHVDRGSFMQTCAPDVQTLYTKIWTELLK